MWHHVNELFNPLVISKDGVQHRYLVNICRQLLPNILEVYFPDDYDRENVCQIFAINICHLFEPHFYQAFGKCLPSVVAKSLDDICAYFIKCLSHFAVYIIHNKVLQSSIHFMM